MEQQWSMVLEPVRSLMIELGQFLPRLVGAVVILLVGWLLAKFLRFIVARGLATIGFGRVTEKAGFDGFLKKGGIKKNTLDVLALLVYWLAIFATFLTAFNILGLTVVSELFRRLTEFVPSVIVAVLILTIGLYFARFVADAVTAYARNVELQDADLIGRLTYYAITVFVVIIALGEMNIADALLYPVFMILLAGVALALALAFGLGGQKWAQDKLEKWCKGKK